MADTIYKLSMPYDLHCQACPYFQQRHLRTELRTIRDSPPVELEVHSSSTLLVFQAPGFMEWVKGKPIQPTKKRGGTAGARIQKSWRRKGKAREDFDIINSVQCFPGNDGNRDLKPISEATLCCAKRLQEVLKQGTYLKIVAFGDVSFRTVTSLTSGIGISSQLVRAAHPNGGVSNTTLDSLW